MKMSIGNKKLKLVERVKQSLGANPKRDRSSSTTKGKHSGGLTSSQRRRRSVQRAELEALRNPWMAF